jgi:enoyl-CoA hydratase/carnithine racemase
MDYTQIQAESRDAVRVLTLNRPERLNAWTRRMMQELSHAIEAANGDPAVGAVVVTGAGRGFCAGADIEDTFKSQLDSDAAQPGRDSAGAAEGSSAEPAGRDWVQLVRDAKPMVAAINGPAIGVGLTMVLPMDFLVAAEGAKLSARFVKMGLVPELASSHFLVQRCGWGMASDLALSGRTLLGGEAAAIGLVDQVVPDDQVLDVAIERASTYAENPAPQLRMIKQLISANGAEVDLRQVQRRELAALQECYTSAEHAEAVAAFMEKRPPVFRR